MAERADERPVRVAIANDTPFAVEALRRLLAPQAGCEVVWVAGDGAEALRRCREEPPDLLLMDLVMPGMDGVEATRRIMREAPCAVLVVTATLDGNLGRVYDALAAGALDAVEGPVLGPDGTLRGAGPILRKIRTLRRLAGPPPPVPEPTPGDGEAGEPSLAQPRPPPLVAIGASIGGPQAVSRILADLDPGFSAPMVLVQHLEPAFVPGFAAWLAEHSGREVGLARPGGRPRPGSLLVADGDAHLRLAADGTLVASASPADVLHRPSVDVFFESLAAVRAVPGVAVLLTGMGRDGAAGLLALRRAGWTTLAQDEVSSVVFGMPRAAHEVGAAERVLPLGEIAAEIEAAWRRAAAARTGTP